MIQKKPEIHKNLLNNITKEYYNQNMRFFHMSQSAKPFMMRVNGGIQYTAEALQLYEDMNMIMAASKQLVDSQRATRSFCNESLLLHIKIIIYTAKLLNAYGSPVESFKAYDTALRVLINYKDKLNYTNDMLFQQELDCVFDVFKAQELREHMNHKDGRVNLIKNIKKSIGILSTSFVYKCGESFVTVGNIYENLLQMLVVARGTKPKKIESLCADFLNMAKKLAQKYKVMKESGDLSTEHSVYYIELNQYLLNITELMQEDSILLVNKTKASEGYFYEADCERMTDKTMISYLNSWDSLKQSIIEPTFLLMKTLNMEEVNTNILIGITYGQALEHWLTITTRTFVLLRNLKEQWIKTHKILDIANEGDIQQTECMVSRLEREMDDVAYKSRLIMKFVALCNGCTLSEVMSGREDIIQLVSVFTDTVNKVKDEMSAKDEKKLQDIHENADALIRQEDKEKVAREKKIRQRHLYFKEKKSTENNEEVKKEIVKKSIAAKSLPIPVNKTLEDLEAIDDTSIKLVRSLKCKTEVSYEQLQLRAKKEVSVPSCLQKEMYININATLIDYYHLVTLRDKHISLSQLDEIKRDEKLKIGIEVSHTELKNTMCVIYNNIQSLLTLFDKIIIRQQIKKEDKLYGWGLKKARKQGLVNLSYAEIIKLGKARFREIGKFKKLNHQDVSEYTKEKKFLNLMQLHFSGFLHLQHKIGPQLFNNYQETLSQFSSFNASLPESYERFEGFLSLILKQQYDEYGDIDYLTEALKHASNSFKKYQIKNTHTPALCEMAQRLAAIEEELAAVNSMDRGLLKQALNHYQDALLYNLEAEEAKMDLSAVEEVNQKISAIQELLGASINNQCSGFEIYPQF